MSTVVATNINTDALVGNTSANAITVRGEGSATTVLNQGLIKVWHHGSQDGTTLEDSFNVGSMTDTGTGRQTVNLTNNMANVNYAPQIGIHYGQSRFLFMENVATSSYQSSAYNANNSGYTDANQNSQVTGDLA